MIARSHFLALFLTLPALPCAVVSSCWDETVYTCEGACEKLARCEGEWTDMDAAETEEFVRDCMRDCDENSESLVCIAETSCDGLREGKCNDRYVLF